MSKILITSCVSQRKEILVEFLESLNNLVKPMEHHYFFVLSNIGKEVRDIINVWSIDKNYKEENMDFPEEYIVNEDTHHWNNKLIDNVMVMKNRIIQEAVDGDYDYLLFVDSDSYLHPDTLTTLISTKKDIVSEICWTKWSKTDIDLPNTWFYDKYGFPSNDLSCFREDNLLQVGGFGGLYLISKKALKAGVSFSRINSLSPTWGEDRHFACRASVLGFSLWCDTSLPFFHIYRLSDLPRLQEWKDNGFKKRELMVSPKNSNVLICVPHIGNIKAELVLWLINTVKNNFNVGINLSYGSPVDSNRNSIVKKFLGDTNFGWLMMVDSDTVPPNNCLDKLLSHDKDIISGVGWSSMGGEKDSEWENESMPYPVVMMKDKDVGWKVDKQKIGGGESLVEVDAVGASCLLINRSVLESVGKSPFRFGYNDWGVVDVVGEDFDFCVKAKERGYKIFVDLSIQCMHYKTVELMGFNRLLQKTVEMNN